MSIRLRTNGKVNLWLRVVSRRRDGYHDVETILQNISLWDDLTISEAPDESLKIDMSWADDRGSLLSSEDNTAYRAALALRRATNTSQGASLHISKRIPIGSGLGGGSANAAGALVGLNSLWRTGLDEGRLAEIGAAVGSDVPFCVRGGVAIARSRGEHVAPLEASRTLWFVLGMSYAPLLTKDVYSLWDSSHTTELTCDEMIAALQSGDEDGVASLLHNELQPFALTLRPELRRRVEAMTEAGALGAVVSGSGPTVFGVCRDRSDADAVAQRIVGTFDRVAVASSRPHGVERTA